MAVLDLLWLPHAATVAVLVVLVTAPAMAVILVVAAMQATGALQQLLLSSSLPSVSQYRAHNQQLLAPI
jgi:hypothetical protein